MLFLNAPFCIFALLNIKPPFPRLTIHGTCTELVISGSSLTSLHMHVHMHECKSCAKLCLVLREDKRGGLYYQFILCGLGYKKTPCSLTVKKSVFNFWETHKSLSLFSYLRHNWKQMPRCSLLSFELANYGVVKIKISLYISVTPFLFPLPSSFFFPSLSLSSLLQSPPPPTHPHPSCFWRNRGGSLMSKSKPRALRKLAKCNTAAIRHDARK